MSPRISVIILTCNQCDTTLRCLAALTPLPRDIELILVDNGSTDGTAGKVNAIHPGVTIVRNHRNLGVAGGRNAGISRASGHYIMLLDNDTVPSIEAIEDLAAYLDTNPRCAIAAPRLVGDDGTTQRSFRPFPGLRVKIRRSSDTVAGSEIPAFPIQPFYVIGAAQLVRRTVFDRIGLLDSRIFYGPEDADLCMRVRQADIGSIDYIPAIVIRHRWRRASRNPLSTLWWRHVISLAYFYCRHRRFL